MQSSVAAAWSKICRHRRHRQRGQWTHRTLSSPPRPSPTPIFENYYDFTISEDQTVTDNFLGGGNQVPEPQRFERASTAPPSPESHHTQVNSSPQNGSEQQAGSSFPALSASERVKEGEDSSKNRQLLCVAQKAYNPAMQKSSSPSSRTRWQPALDLQGPATTHHRQVHPRLGPAPPTTSRVVRPINTAIAAHPRAAPAGSPPPPPTPPPPTTPSRHARLTTSSGSEHRVPSPPLKGEKPLAVPAPTTPKPSTTRRYQLARHRQAPRRRPYRHRARSRDPTTTPSLAA